MARSRRKSRKKSPARRRRRSPAVARRRSPSRKQRGFLSSPAAKSALHAVLGAGVAAAADTVPALSSKASGIPGGSATVVAGVCGVIALTSKNASRRKMFGAMAVGAAGFAAVDYAKGGPDWSVRDVLPSMSSGAGSVISLPRQTQASSAVSDFLKSKDPAAA